ncbi:MAG: amidohydrolase family protein [Planctomycetota bacterium]
MRLRFLCSVLLWLSPTWCEGQTPPQLPLSEFRPKPMLRVPVTPLTKARYPVVDVHNHFGFKLPRSGYNLDEYVAAMDRNNIAVAVSLDGGLGEDWSPHEKLLWSKYKDRFAIFVHLDWRGDGDPARPETWACNQPGFARLIARQLAEAKQQGASGLKLFKQFGLGYRDGEGQLIRIDDPRWDPIWEACGKLELPVIMHAADPAAFFEPIDATNERWEELSRHPDWHFGGEDYPSRAELLEARNRVIERHPQTTFIGAHVANNAEDLAAVASWLDKYPNLVVEIASRIGELGRQPYTTRDFLIKYADRVMFGTDGPWPEPRLRYYWRFLETRDEYFPYSEKPFPPQGFWRIYGVYLPDEVLRKIYYQNAMRIIPGVRERLLQQFPELEADHE